MEHAIYHVKYFFIFKYRVKNEVEIETGLPPLRFYYCWCTATQ